MPTAEESRFRMITALATYFAEDSRAFGLLEKLIEEGPQQLSALRNEQSYIWLLDKRLITCFREAGVTYAGITPHGEYVVKKVRERTDCINAYLDVIMREGL